MKIVFAIFILAISGNLYGQNYTKLISESDQIVTINHLSLKPIDSVSIDGKKHYLTQFGRVAPSFYSKYEYQFGDRLLYRYLPDRSQSHAHYGKWIAFLKCESGSCSENPNYQLNNREELNYYGYMTIMDEGLIPYSKYEEEKIKSFLLNKKEESITLESLYNFSDYVAHVKTDTGKISNGGGITQEAGTNWQFISFDTIEKFKTPSSNSIRNANPLNQRVVYGFTQPLPENFWIVHGYDPIPPDYLKEDTEYIVFLRCGHTSIGNEFLASPSRVGNPCLSSMIALRKGIKPYTSELKTQVEKMEENGRKNGDCSNVTANFEQYVKETLKDTSERYKDFIPSPPRLPCYLLAYLQTELISDSAKYYFNLLHASRDLHVLELKKSISYFKRKQLPFCLMACAFHWHPDVRGISMEQLFNYLTTKYKIKASDAWKRRFFKKERSMLKCGLYLLENYPGPFGGSENVTVHENYRNQLILCIKSICEELNINSDQVRLPLAGYTKEDFKRWKSQIYKRYGD